MRHSLPTAAGFAVEPRTFRSVPIPNARPEMRPGGAPQATRRYQISCMGSSANIMKFSRVAPALGVIDAAFGAMAHGTVISTNNGPVAIEDLTPGIRVQTRDNGPQPVLWIGSTSLLPGQPGAPDYLLRITADGLGLSRPEFGLMLGPEARLLHRHCGAGLVLAPISGFCDGEHVVQTRSVSPVQLFHIAFARHQIIRANGIEIESYHPGPSAEMQLSREFYATYMGLFPNYSSPDSFGPLAYRRVAKNEMFGLMAG